MEERLSVMSSSKWTATVAGIWIQCSVGAYTFSIYSSALKSSQGYDQSTLDTVAVFKDIGSNAGVLAGMLYSAVAVGNNRNSNYFWGGGPWVVHLAGAIQNFVGYFMVWACVVRLVRRPPVAVMCLFMLLSSHSMTFFTTANMVSGVQNFPHSGGTIVGIMKGFLGISGAIVIQVYDTFWEGKPSIFLLMLALLPTFVTLVLMFFVRIHKSNTANDQKHLNGFTIVALIIAGYLMILIILENIFSLPLWARIFNFVLLLLLLASPLGIAIKAQKGTKKFLETLTLENDPSMENPLAYDELPGGEGQVDADLDDKILSDEEGMNLLQSMCTINFWLLFVAMVCGMGSGVAVVNNLSQIGQSLNYTTMETKNLVSLWSIWNFLGRIGAGYISDYLLHTRGWARPLLMAITLATMGVGHLVVASGLPGTLYVGSILVGICYGSQWSLMPTISSELFGVRHVGTIFNTIGIASPVGSYIFSVRVIGYIYDEEAKGEDDSCYGTHCFRLSFMIMASVAFLGFLVALTLLFLTKRFYQLVVLKRIKLSLS